MDEWFLLDFLTINCSPLIVQDAWHRLHTLYCSDKWEKIKTFVSAMMFREIPPLWSYRVLQHFLTGYFIQIRSMMIVIQRALGFPFVTSSRTCSRMWLLMNDYQLWLITNLQKYCIHIQCWEMLHSLLFTLLDCNKIIKFTRTDILLFLYNDIKNIAKEDY